MAQRIPQGADVQIEFPSMGATYSRERYGVYAYDTYPRSSVLAGQTRRSFIESFETLEEAQKAYPGVKFCGPAYQEPNLSHLPDEDDNGDEYFSREQDRDGY